MAADMTWVAGNSWQCRLYSQAPDSLQTVATGSTPSACYERQPCLITTTSTTTTMPFCALSGLFFVNASICDCGAASDSITTPNLIELHCVYLCNTDASCIAAEMTNRNGVYYDCTHYFGNADGLCTVDASYNADRNTNANTSSNNLCYVKSCSTTTTITNTTLTSTTTSTTITSTSSSESNVTNSSSTNTTT